jgi:hypothetical protein
MLDVDFQEWRHEQFKTGSSYVRKSNQMSVVSAAVRRLPFVLTQPASKRQSAIPVDLSSQRGTDAGPNESRVEEIKKRGRWDLRLI